MTIPYRYRPGAGFLLSAAALVGGTCFFIWGIQTPPLDRVWRMQLELKIGAREALSPGEMELLQVTLSQYPDLADHMLEGAQSGMISAGAGHVVDGGYAYLVRKSPAADSSVEVSSGTGKKITVEIRTARSRERGVVDEGKSGRWDLPQEGPFPQLIGVHQVRDGAVQGRDTTAPVPMRVELAAAR